MTMSRAAAPEWLAHPEHCGAPSMKFVVWVARRLGRPAARLLRLPICLYFVLLSATARAASRAYLARALGRRPRWSDVFRHFHAFAACLLDRVFLLDERQALFDFRLHGAEIVNTLIARREGCLLLGAHLGSFEAVRALNVRMPGPGVGLMMYEENARKIGSVLSALNPTLALDIVGLGRLDSMLAVKERVDQGDFVGILADRSFSGEGQKRCSFLGAPAGFPLGPFRIAALLKCPVVLMFGLYRGGRRYDIHFEPLSLPLDGPRAARDSAVAAALESYVARLEHHCRAAPYNWFNFYDFWK